MKAIKLATAQRKEMEGKSSREAKWVMDGRFLRQEYSSTFAGKPLTIVRYLGFDRHIGRKPMDPQFHSVMNAAFAGDLAAFREICMA